MLCPGFQSFYNRQKALISAVALSMLLEHASKKRGKALSLRRQGSKNTHAARLDEYNGLEHVRRCKWMLPLQTKQHSRTSSLLWRSSVTQGKENHLLVCSVFSATGFVTPIRHYYTWALSSSITTAQAKTGTLSMGQLNAGCLKTKHAHYNLCSTSKKKINQVSQTISLQIQTASQQNSLLARNLVNSKLNLISRKNDPSLTSELQRIGLFPIKLVKNQLRYLYLVLQLGGSKMN